MLNSRNLKTLVIFFFLVISIPITVFLLNQLKDTRSRAKEDIEKHRRISPDEIEKELNNKISSKIIEVESATKTLSLNAPAAKKNSGGKLREAIIKKSQERKEDIIDLAKLDPAAAKEQLLEDKKLSDLSSVSGMVIEKKVVIKGKFVEGYLHTTDDKGNIVSSEVQNQIIVGNDYVNQKVYTIYSDDPLLKENVESDVKVEGYQLDDNIIATKIGEVIPDKVLGAVTGPLKVAVFLLHSPNAPGGNVPIDRAYFEKLYNGDPGKDVVSYFKEVSFNKLQIQPTFFGSFELPTDILNSVGCSTNLMSSPIVKTFLQGKGVDFSQFQKFIYIAKCLTSDPKLRSSGTGLGGGDSLFIGDTAGFLRLNTHEIGHAIGFTHTQFWDCFPSGQFKTADRFTFPPCYSQEYGDSWDAMGHTPSDSGDLSGHFVATNKYIAGWFDPGNFITLDQPGTYTYNLSPIETPSTGPMALYIPKGNGNGFTIEYRQPVGFDSWMVDTSSISDLTSKRICPYCNVTQGVNIKYTTGNLKVSNGIDATPLSLDSVVAVPGYFMFVSDYNDGALLPGKSFTDSETGIKITTNSLSPSAANVTVELPQASCTRNNPSVTVSPSSLTGNAFVTAPYTLTVKNNDGASCPPQLFKPYPEYQNLIQIDGKSETTIFTPSEVMLSPGQTANISFTHKFLDNRPYGTYNIVDYICGQSLDSNCASINYQYIYSGTADTNAPSIPTNFQAKANGSKQVDLSWNQSSDNQGGVSYRVKVIVDGATSSEFKTFENTSAVDYLIPTSTYSFQVRAEDKNGNTSDYTNSIEIPVRNPDTVKPSQVSDFKAQSIDSRTIKLSWTGATDNIGIGHYSIRRDGGIAFGLSSILLDGSKTSFTDTSVIPNHNYTYTIRPIDGSGNEASGIPLEVKVTTPKVGTLSPTTPTNIIVLPINFKRIALLWGKSTDDVGISGYNIFDNNQKVGTSNSNAYSYDRADYYNPFHNFYISSIDSEENESARSSAIFISNSNIPIYGDVVKPIAAITSPNNGANITGVTNININATDDKGVVGAELYVDNALISASNTSPFTLSFDAAKISNGTHALQVKAYDANDNFGESNIINVNISGSIITPTPSISVTSTPTPIPTNTLTPTPTGLPIPTSTPTILPSSTPISTPTPSISSCSKVGDINCDNQVGIIDLSILLSNWNTSNSVPDLNHDGTVGIVDLSILLSNWGK